MDSIDVKNEEQKHFERPTSHSPEFPLVKRVIYLVVVVSIGIITGATGFFIAESQIPSRQYFSYPSEITINQLQPQSTGRSVYDATAVARSQTVSIIKQRTRVADQYDQLIDPADYIGSGVIATSDGWVMTILPAAQLTKVAVVIRGTIYNAEKVSTDPLTGITFLKTNIPSLTPVSIGNASDAGDMLVAFGAGNETIPHPVVTRVLQKSYVPVHSKLDYIRSSDSLSEYVLIDGSLEQGFAKAFFTGDAKFAGFTTQKNNDLLLVPPTIIRLALEQALRKEVSKDLGIYYIVNTSITADDSSESITLYHPTHAAVRAGSLAAKAGLRNGDTIRSVAGEMITADSSFDYLWKKHQQDINGLQLVIVRNGVEGQVQVSW
jgi:S1-C subfamily serine protease